MYEGLYLEIRRVCLTMKENFWRHGRFHYD